MKSTIQTARTITPIETLYIANAEAAWQTKHQPQGPCCEWPRWIGGDPAERWPSQAA